MLGLSSKEEVLGKRPGEAIHCVYSDKEEGGCGTSEFCSECNAVKAILRAFTGVTSIEECSILTKSNDAINLRLWATPFTFGNERYVAFSIQDISAEKLYKNLQKIFFHDIQNLAGGISGMVEILAEENKDENCRKYLEALKDASQRLNSEIATQRELNKVNYGDFQIFIDSFSSETLLKTVVSLYSAHEAAQGKNIIILSDSEDINVISDQTLLLRVLGNILKNALEASEPGDSVSLKCAKADGSAIFSVHNNSFMSRDIQLQVFKRAFSTKGADRGIGTHSMKLIGENLLNGKVYFESSLENGTTFYIKLGLNK